MCGGGGVRVAVGPQILPLVSSGTSGMKSMKEVVGVRRLEGEGGGGGEEGAG